MNPKIIEQVFEKEIERRVRAGLTKITLVAVIIGGKHPTDSSKSGGLKYTQFVYDIENPLKEIPELKDCTYIHMANEINPCFGCTMSHEEREAYLNSL